MIVFDRGLAEDAVQTAFIKAAERIHQFDAKRPFAPWFFRIVVNDALKFVKRQKRNISLENLDEPATQIAEWLAASGFQPEPRLEQRKMRENILRAIQSLPPEQRAGDDCTGRKPSLCAIGNNSMCST